MTLLVEDGTGVAGAESYASVSAASDYWAKRPQDALAAAWTASAAPIQEGALREATAYLDATWGSGYLGGRASAAQGLLWPRVTVLAYPGACLPLYRHYGLSRPYGLVYPFGDYPVGDLVFWEAETDGCNVDLTIVYGADGFALAALPIQIVNATIELAARALSQRLAPDYQAGQRVKMEKAGDTAFEYFDDGRASASFGILSRMLIPVLGAAGQSGWAWR
jgi:hypothetical protein